VRVQIEIESVAAFRSHVEAGLPWRDVVVQGLDLIDEPLLLTVSVTGAVFLGCALSADALTHVIATGGIVFPRLPGLAYDASRSTLYTVDELMRGMIENDEKSFFVDSTDAKIYAQYSKHRAHPPLMEAFAQRLHDHAIDDALGDLLAKEPRRIVAFMGGHAMARTDIAYPDVARCARSLARAGFFIITGGGPGAMEAANLGAFLAPCDDAFLEEALVHLREAPLYKSPGWLATADSIRRRAPKRGDTLGVPTWFYGHEPTNLFCTHVAKYFSNALREDGLLAIAKHGVVYAPGGPGTVQEIFMDACQNHYGTFDDVSPMVFLGTTYWRETRPVYPLLELLAKGAQYSTLLGIFDAPDDVVAFLQSHPPMPYVKGK
jgi:predicted Rossmann-fold nucleotide-binding protein